MQECVGESVAITETSILLFMMTTLTTPFPRIRGGIKRKEAYVYGDK